MVKEKFFPRKGILFKNRQHLLAANRYRQGLRDLLFNERQK